MITNRYHMIFDAENCQTKNWTEKGLEFLIEIIADKIDMNILLGPYEAEGIPENPGMSGFSIIDFSHISVHTFTKSDEILIDVFSCKPFDSKKLYEFLKKDLNLEDKDIRSGLVDYNKLEKIQ